MCLRSDFSTDLFLNLRKSVDSLLSHVAPEKSIASRLKSIQSKCYRIILIYITKRRRLLNLINYLKCTHVSFPAVYTVDLHELGN